MTKADKPVRRETYTSVRGSGKFKWYPLVVELHATFMRVRPKGKRQVYTITYDQLWTLGAKNQAAAAAAERAEKRKAKKAEGRK